jgi:lipopolysaccharide transport system ATP-binding protein
MSTIIKVEHIGKQYRLGTVGTGTLSHDLNRWWAKVRGKQDPFLTLGESNDRTQKASDSDLVWALRDVNFEVKQGDVLGIVGRNGAGKSTLLKILSRTTTPSTGEFKVKGRIASLLEVGTGFHPELTGRENIFLNGAILGMRKHEIIRKFDEIVEFSGVERYIDTPVKRYSSGMYVRLAFAVAAHLEPEILIVDEVLAVGDLEFQKKCIGKMKDVSEKDGRTVLFVSHNMSAIKSLCTSGILLKNGTLALSGSIDDVLNEYLNEQEAFSKVSISDIHRNEGSGVLTFTDIHFINAKGEHKTDFVTGESLEIRVEFTTTPAFKQAKSSRIDIGINDLFGNRVTWMSSAIFDDKIDESKSYISFFIDKVLLSEGRYNVNLYCSTHEGVADWVKNASAINIHYKDFFGTGKNIPQNQGGFITEFKLNN